MDERYLLKDLVPIVLLASIIAIGNSAAARAQELPGEASYTKVCQVCHGPQGRGSLAPPLVPMTRETDEVLAIVREGTGQMPPISKRELTDEQVVEVVEYLRSLTASKPQAASSSKSSTTIPIANRPISNR